MTVPLSVPAAPAATAPVDLPAINTKVADTAAARKRRRRAPAGGAADDCFTCSKRNVKCDRRRPYCSPCLEVGNECSGYKTQLTWGVGVASRGKLRGLSLPVAKAPPVSTAICKKGSPTRTRAGSTNVGTAGQWPERDESAAKRRPTDLQIHTAVRDFDHHHGVSSPSTPFHGAFDPSRIPRAVDATPTLPHHASHWDHMPFSASLPSDNMRYGKLSHGMGHADHQLSSSIESISDMEYHLSPMSHSFPRDEIPFLHSPTVLYDSFTGHNSPAVPPSPLAAMIMEQRNAPTSCPGLVYAPSEQSSSLHSHPETFEAQLSSKLLLDCDSIGTPELDAYSSSANSNGHFWGPSAADEDSASSQGVPEPTHSLAAWPSAVETPMVHVTPDLIAKMPFFLDYYENTMCPSMVFIDGPNNPFREHILQLAAGSRSLQHAICALAACNLRMKRRLSLGQHSPRDMADKRPGSPDGSADDQSLHEEYQHRNLAVHLLNEQLNDTTKSKHDSVLATILILCHYRMAESGIARFHTQFAGVKKILSMRRASSYPPSPDSAWMESLFTYFDAISASINDREAQLSAPLYSGVPLDSTPLLPPGTENLVGCDRELFRIIVRLGRLNLLSQHRPVQNMGAGSPLQRHVPSRSQSPLASPLGHMYKPGQQQQQQQQQRMGIDMFGVPTGGNHHRFDGNGFGTTLNDDELMSAALSSSPAYDEHRTAFWREWKEARNALQTWSFDGQRLASSMVPTPTPAQMRDLCSLSEAFRYAALLYTERLAGPDVPSSHEQFRNLVSQVVYYATSLEAGSSAEKFLLWPLFVAGSECVNELQQNIVRNKCRDIMARSGYMNNLAALDVLERLWAGEEPAGAIAIKEEQHSSHLGGIDMGPPSHPHHQHHYQHHQQRLPGMMNNGPFNWARCIGGQGVEVEWIMF